MVVRIAAKAELHHVGIARIKMSAAVLATSDYTAPKPNSQMSRSECTPAPGPC